MCLECFLPLLLCQGPRILLPDKGAEEVGSRIETGLFLCMLCHRVLWLLV